ncbi:DUF7144 family membrane protein [Conexibacter woesei]|uniref:DUF7144 family membrane protein n=1 Tax=Conexibacter woesei TaxID=191495 RepID=UPI0004046294|nr:hypothetical protein [Conexibacter woesei]
MATSSSRRYDDVGVNGWQAFAGVILFLNGVFGFLYGLAAVLNDEVVTVGGGTGVTVWDFTAWGWVQMVIGVLMAATSIGLFMMKGWARFAALVFCMINVLVQFGTISAFPLWALLVIALDIIIIYQLTTNWATDDLG